MLYSRLNEHRLGRRRREEEEEEEEGRRRRKKKKKKKSICLPEAEEEEHLPAWSPWQHRAIHVVFSSLGMAYVIGYNLVP